MSMSFPPPSKSFAASISVNYDAIPSKLKKVIDITLTPYISFVGVLEQHPISKSNKMSDALACHFIARLFNNVSGMLGASSVGNLQSAEIVSRSVMESSITLLYILEKDTNKRFMQFLKSYIEQEKSQNKKWLMSLASLSADWQKDNNTRINEKNDFLLSCETLLITHAASLGDYASEKCLPNLIDLCKSLGREVEYRTIFMAMSSQAHQDAEDILNQFIVDFITDSNKQEAYESQVLIEKHNFSVFLILHGIRFFLQSLLKFSECYSMREISSQSVQAIEKITLHITDVCKDSFASTLDGWLAQDKI